MSLTLILGGARSGKSSYAHRLALGLSPSPVYVATSRGWDDDHKQRIARHRRERGSEWRSIEEPLALSSLELAGEVVVVDCVTLWLTNFFSECKRGDRYDVDACLDRAKAELTRMFERDNVWILVSNEVGLSLHAATEAGRKFVDLQGFVNQHLAARADCVVFMLAGLPLFVKGRSPGDVA